MPKASIVIPTLNRAHLLKHALKSAVLQDYKDLEIIVADDCSDDNTKEVAESFNDGRIVYIRPEERLNMTDIFEFALSKANGEYLAFPTDAIYLLPNFVSRSIKKMEESGAKISISINSVYCYPDWMEKVRGNTLQIPVYTFKTQIVDSRSALAKFFDNIREPIIPKSINSLCHRSVIEKAIKTQGHFFSQPVPDHTSAVTMLANTDKFVFVNEPLFLGSLSSSNIGASQSFNLGAQAQNFLNSFPGKKMEEITFLGIYTTASLIMKGMMDAGKFYPDCPKINIKNALSEIADSLTKLQAYGTNVGNYWKILDDYIDKNHKELKPAIRQRRIRSAIKWKAVKTIRSRSWLYNFESAIRGMKILRGEKYGFNNIEEAAGIVKKLNAKN